MTITPNALREAAQRFSLRTDSFAAGKAAICMDLASKLQRYGQFASEKQAGFAEKLINWSIPRPEVPASSITFPNVADLINDQGLSLHLGKFKVVKFKHGAIGLVSPVFGQGTYGVIDSDGTFKRFGSCSDEMVAALLDVETNGLEAVKRIGKATGRCCVCAKKLTDEGSIEAGIGPVCATKFN